MIVLYVYMYRRKIIREFTPLNGYHKANTTVCDGIGRGECRWMLSARVLEALGKQTFRSKALDSPTRLSTVSQNARQPRMVKKQHSGLHFFDGWQILRMRTRWISLSGIFEGKGLLLKA